MNVKTVFILLILNSILATASFSQSFFKDYRNFIENQYYIHNPKKELDSSLIKSRIDNLSKLFYLVRGKEKTSMLNADTIYMLNFAGALGNSTKLLVWNKAHSCLYDYSFGSNGKTLTQKFIWETDASQEFKLIASDLIKLAETADTVKYKSYSNSNKVWADGDRVGIIVAIKHRKYWQFISSDYFDYPIK